MKTILQRTRGFTLVEILVVVVTILLLLFVMIPALTRTTGQHKRVACVNNLKQIGLAARLWSSDGPQGEFPWLARSGGSRTFVNSPQVFQHFAIMSNELVTPKILACSLDLKRSRATNFTNFSNTNLSYFVGLDADETKPERLLSGDRNITGGVFTNGFLRLLKTNSPAGWTKEMHDYGGNVGLSDGSVRQMMAQQLQWQLQSNTLPLIRLAIP
jgi:type II secretory pathway pseudopilin PulG